MPDRALSFGHVGRTNEKGSDSMQTERQRAPKVPWLFDEQIEAPHGLATGAAGHVPTVAAEGDD